MAFSCFSKVKNELSISTFKPTWTQSPLRETPLILRIKVCMQVLGCNTKSMECSFKVLIKKTQYLQFCDNKVHLLRRKAVVRLKAPEQQLTDSKYGSTGSLVESVCNKNSGRISCASSCHTEGSHTASKKTDDDPTLTALSVTRTKTRNYDVR